MRAPVVVMARAPTQREAADAGELPDVRVAAMDAAVDAVRAPPAERLVRAAATDTAARCGSLQSPDGEGHFVAREDLVTPLAPVDGSALLAVVDRSARFALSSGYAPADLVDVETLHPASVAYCEPPGGQCLRREAALALRSMMDAMRAHGTPGYVHSAFRAFDAQCAVFRRWSRQDGQGMCQASTASALAGHSQHQLGTALDLFTVQWARGGGVIRPGFGCTEGGRWLAEHGWEYGFVLPYPLPLDERASGSMCERRAGTGDRIDPRTGYRYEPWHVRYIGVEHARAFHEAWRASGPGTETELTLGQWLRARVGIAGDADLPVCDGCACGACTTFATGDAATTPCGARALVLGADGEPVTEEAAPEIEAVDAANEGEHTRVTIHLRVAAHTTTQTPVDPRGHPAGRYPSLPGAWRLVLENTVGEGLSVRAAIWEGEAGRLDGANTLLPAPAGRPTVTVRVPRVSVLRVGLEHNGAVTGVREINSHAL